MKIRKKNLHSQDNPVSFITIWNGINNIIVVAEVDQQKTNFASSKLYVIQHLFVLNTIN